MYFVYHKILYKIQNFAMAKNFFKQHGSNTGMVRQRIFSNNMVQTLAWLMFNKFKRDCFDVKATVFQTIYLTVHLEEESLSVRH